MTSRRFVALSFLLVVAPAAAHAAGATPSPSWQQLGFTALVIFPMLLAFGWFGRTWLSRRQRPDALLEGLPGGVAVYRGRTVGPFWHSPAFARLLGTPALLPAEGIAQADRPRFVAAFGELRAKGEAFDLRLARASDGDPLRIVGRRSASGDDLLWVAEADATAGPDGFAALLDSLPMPVWLRGADLSLAWCNVAYAKLVDRDRSTVLRESIELGRGIIGEGGLGLARRAQSLGRPQEESHHLVTTGRRLLFEFTEAPLPDGRLVGHARDVTAIEATQAELGRHVAGQDELLEHLSTGVAIYGPDSRLRSYNRAYLRMFSMDDEFLRTRPTADEMFDVLRARRQVEDLPDFPAFKREQIRRLMSVVEPFESLLHQPSGTTIRRIVAPHPFGGIMAIYDDVTDRLALERSYNTLIEVQRDTLDNLSEGVAVFGGDGRLKLNNPAFARLWNLGAGDLAGEPHFAAIGEAFRALFQPEDWQSLRQQMIAGMEDRRPRAGRFTRTDGRVVDFVALPLPDGSALYRFADVTDSVQVQRALVERNEALETTDRLKTEFLANISYELRTPLTTIIGFSEMLDRRFFGPLNDRQAEYAVGIVSASRSLLRLIDDILDLANIEAGYLQLNPKPLDPTTLFQDLGALVQERARSRGLVLAFEGADTIGAVIADERRLKQALFNLISNSIKFTPEGGQVVVSARRVDEVAEFSVADTGVGIAPEDQTRVFDKFVRVGTGRQGGVGLGLALVHSLIGLHGGSISLSSEPGKGTTVVCRIPLAGPPVQQPAAA
jgi:signal transduction histidine kinase